MTQEEHVRMPPLEIMRQVLDDNLPLVRLLDATFDYQSQSAHAQLGADSAVHAEPSDVLTSMYREVLELLEILSATADRGGPSTRQIYADTSEPASATPSTTV